MKLGGHGAQSFLKEATNSATPQGSRNPQINAFSAWFGTTILWGKASFVNGDVEWFASHAVILARS